MQENHDAAAQTAAHSTTGAPADSAPSLPLHPSAAISPPMRESEFEALVADIREKGQLEAIWLWQGQVIDGRHRVRACQKLGLTPKTREWDGQGSLLEFIVSANLRRRHLKENQRAMVAARMLPHFEEEALLRKNVKDVVKSQHMVNLPYGPARELAGKCLGVSGKSVDYARSLLDHGIPALIARVDAGQLAVSTAAKIAALSPEEQARLLALSKREMLEALRPEPAPQSPLTESDAQLDPELLRHFGPAHAAQFEKCSEGLRLKLPSDHWRRTLSNLIHHPHFQSLLEHGVTLVRKP